MKTAIEIAAPFVCCAPLFILGLLELLATLIGNSEVDQ